MWPYGVTQAKAALPVGAKPLICHTLEQLEEVGIQEVTIVAGHLESQLRQAVMEIDNKTMTIDWVSQPAPVGTAEALQRYLESVSSDGEKRQDNPEAVLVMYGDVFMWADDVKRLMECHLKSQAALTLAVASLEEDPPNDWICARVESDRVKRVLAHPRGSVSHRFAGAFVFGADTFPYVAATGAYGAPVQVGVMPDSERDLVTTIDLILNRGMDVAAVECREPTFDLDKPWHLLEANRVYARRVAGGLTENIIHPSAYVDSTARIDGYVHLGEGARIEGPCIIKGNVVAGAGTVIRDGAILMGNTVIGEECSIAHGCYIDSDSVIGDRCIVDHAAEFFGVLMENVYLYHYMEIAGIVGRSTDIGAGSVCGTLRFDDGKTTHRVKGRPEQPATGANVSYIGDFCRLGVNAILMPGAKVGPYSLVGPGVILDHDLPERTRIFVQQTHTTAPWGPERYGW